MGVYTFTLDDKVVSELKQWVISKHGKLHKKLSKTVEQAIKEFLERKKQELVVEGKPETISKFTKAAMKAVTEATLEEAKEKGELSEEGFERFKREISKFVEIVPEKGPERAASTNVEEIKRMIERGDVAEVTKLVLGTEELPPSTSVAVLKKKLRRLGINEAYAELLKRRLISQGYYLEWGNLLVNEAKKKKLEELERREAE